jgi:uncharacterized protein YjbI with pentapeptide repeats
MRKLRNFLLVAGAWIASALSTTTYAQSSSDLGEPIITIKTNAYAELGESNTFSILIGTTENNVYFDVDQGFGTEEFEAQIATLDSVSDLVGSVLYGRVSEKGEIKIYGDASKIDVINASGCYITEIDLSKCVNLDILNLEHNELTSLNLTPNTKLRAIYLSDNPGTEASPIIVGAPKNDLQILEVDIIDYLDPNFTPNYPNLRLLDCYATKKLNKLDLSGCPNLVNLVVELTAVDTLDLSKVPDMVHLNISESRIKDIDLSVVPKLSEFYCSHSSGTVNTDVKMEKIDVTKNPELTYISASDNKLSELDVTKNPKLQTLYARHNNLSTLDLTNNNSIVGLDLTGNKFTYSTLPNYIDTMTEYYYSQQAYSVNKSQQIETPIDFTAMLRKVSDDDTTYVRVLSIPVGGEEAELDSINYTWKDGYLTFHNALSDSVYVEFANTAFAEYSLKSSNFMVKSADDMGKPSLMATITVLNNFTQTFKVGMSGATTETPATIYVDFGNGELKDFAVTSSDASTTISGKSTGTKLKIYVPENGVLSALNLDNNIILGLDLSPAGELRKLSAAGCYISSINLEANRCLEELNLSNNSLSTLDLSGLSAGGYEKNFLTHIEAANNKLTEFTIVNTRGCEYLDLSNNRLTEINLKDFDNMHHLDLHGNQLSTVLLSYTEDAEYIDLSNNNLTEIESIVDMPSLTNFNISNNALTLATLPYFETAPATYTYAPQATITIAEKAPSVALASQYVTYNGQSTVYTWIKEDDTVLVEGTDYTISNGLTRFLTIDGKAVKCRITHPAFPALSGDNALYTTQVVPMGAPTTVIATFTVNSIADGALIGFTTTKVSNVYIDWRGDGQDYQEFPTSTEYSYSTDLSAVEGKKAILYTYDDPSDIRVISIRGIGMDDFDGSPMTALKALGLYNTGLTADKVTYPNKATIEELLIDGSAFDTIDLAQFPAVRTLVLNNSKLETIDLSTAPQLETASLGGNNLSSIKFNNPKLWGLDLTNNNFSTIDLHNLPVLRQLLMSNNKLSSIDLSPVASTLVALVLVSNQFTFATLPNKADFPNMVDAYYYGNQASVEVPVVDHKVDLSSQAHIGEYDTVYTWYYGEITVDTDTGEIDGELMSDGTDGGTQEYTIENGVTTFLVEYDEPVICVMTNETYPNLALYTTYLDISKSTSGIDNISAGINGGNDIVNVYNLQGSVVRKGVKAATATDGLAPGIYIVGNRKVLVR